MDQPNIKNPATGISLGPVHEFICISFRTGNLNCFRVNDHDEQHGMCAEG